MTDLDLLDLIMITRPEELEDDVFKEIEEGVALFKVPGGDVAMETGDAICLIEWLRGLAAVGKSPLTGTVYRGFVANGMWLTKQEVKADDNS